MGEDCGSGSVDSLCVHGTYGAIKGYVRDVSFGLKGFDFFGVEGFYLTVLFHKHKWVSAVSHKELRTLYWLLRKLILF